MLYNIWVTRRCNLSCRYCYEGSNKEEKDFQYENIDHFIKFIKETNKNGKRIWVNFHGGEPLLKFDLIKEIISKIKYNNIEAKYSLTTNGTLLTDLIIEDILKNNIDISLSIDGEKRVHDLNRRFKSGVGTYDIVRKNFVKLLDRLPNIRVRLTFNSKTVSYLKESVEHLIMIGAKNIILGPDYFDGGWNKHTIKMFGLQLKNIKQFVGNNDVYISWINDKDYKKLGRCSGGITEYSIDADGVVYPCVYVVGNSKFEIGKIDKGLNKDKIDKVQIVYSSHSDKCSGCNYLEYCISNRCKFLNYALEGILTEPSCVVCLMEHEKIENIIIKNEIN